MIQPNPITLPTGSPGYYISWHQGANVYDFNAAALTALSGANTAHCSMALTQIAALALFTIPDPTGLPAGIWTPKVWQISGVAADFTADASPIYELGTINWDGTSVVDVASPQTTTPLVIFQWMAGTDADSTPTIAIVRTDTSETVVATTSTGVVHVPTGQYSYTLSSPIAGITYRATWTALFGGQTISWQATITASTGSVASWFYSSQPYVEKLIKTINEVIVFDAEDGSVDTSAIQSAGDWSDSYINLKLRKSGLAAPADLTDATISHNLREASTRLVVWSGFSGRGLQELSPTQPGQGIAGIMSGYKKFADELIDGVVGIIQAASTTSSDGELDWRSGGSSEAVTPSLNNNDVNRMVALGHCGGVIWPPC